MAYGPEWDSQTGNLPKGVPTPYETLGYQILRWCETYIVQPDGERAGEPWKFTSEQKRFILWAYSITETGEWRHGRVSLRRSKGWGKTPLLAALAIIEFIGPCRFGSWAEDGQPIAVSVKLPLVQIAAVSLEQTANTRDMIRGMLSESPAEAIYGLEIGKERIQFKDGKPGRIEPVASSSRGLEGARPTFVICDETHHWIASNGGVYVYETLQRNVDKTMKAGSRLMQTTNAFNPNEDSVAQRTYDAFMSGRTRLLYDCREGQSVEDLTDTEAVIAALKQAYGDSHWAPVEGLVDLATDPLTPNAVFWRFYLNQIAESADNWIDKYTWDELRLDDDPILPDDQVALGFDGSLRSDATAIVGVRLRDGKLFLVHLQEQDENDPDWQVNQFLVDRAMRQARETYRVEWIMCDPSYWQNLVGVWSLDFKELDRDGRDIVFEFPPQRVGKMVAAVERFHTAVLLRDGICHDGDKDLSRHITNTVTYEVPQGVLITKESKTSKRKIDAAMAAVLAYEARGMAIEDGRMKIRRKARMRSY
ncbi:hypothetical protein [Spirillospora sp. CA-294931]|uniref:hypothetical protein n=1 Tax=Spirillospora sp. CA-294931 TaxID=3240042 RepID=UPI003D91EEEA